MEFAERLKELRTQKDLSQQELADRLGLSNSAISMYERGEREPSLGILEMIADFFGVSTNYLLGRDVYYSDEEAARMAQELYERPELRVLFDASRNATKEDIEQVASILEKLSQK